MRILVALIVFVALALAIVAPAAARHARQPSWREEFSAGLGAFVGFDHDYGSQKAEAGQCTVANGVLSLTTAYRSPGVYAIAMALTTRTFDHGYFEARIKYPLGQALTPSFWLRRPASAPTPWTEIDIMEAFPNTGGQWPGPNRFQSTLHYLSGTGTAWHQVTTDAGTSLAGAWHTFGLNWLPGTSLTFYLDGANVGSITADVLPATAMTIVVSMGVGSWSAPADATTPATATMQVDYVRWWDRKP